MFIVLNPLFADLGYSTLASAVRALKRHGIEYTEEECDSGPPLGRPASTILLTEEMFRAFCAKAPKRFGAGVPPIEHGGRMSARNDAKAILAAIVRESRVIDGTTIHDAKAQDEDAVATAHRLHHRTIWRHLLARDSLVDEARQLKGVSEALDVLVASLTPPAPTLNWAKK